MNPLLEVRVVDLHRQDIQREIRRNHLANQARPGVGLSHLLVAFGEKMVSLGHRLEGPKNLANAGISRTTLTYEKAA